MDEEPAADLPYVRNMIRDVLSQGLDRIEERLDKKLQFQFEKLQASNQQTLIQLQEIKKKLLWNEVSSLRDCMNAFPPGASKTRQPHTFDGPDSAVPARDLEPLDAKGPVAESAESYEACEVQARSAGSRQLSLIPTSSEKARRASIVTTFEDLAGQQAKARKVDLDPGLLADMESSSRMGSFRGSFRGGKLLVADRTIWHKLWRRIKEPLHPEGLLRTRWDILLLLFLLYICFTAPVMICFDVNLDSSDPLWWFELIVMGFFILDVILNFNTSYRDHNEQLVKNRWRIAYHYAITWFVIDLLAVIPFDYITIQDTDEDLGVNTGSSDVESVQLLKGLRLAKFTRILRVLRVVKLLRLLKILRLPGVMKRLSSISGENTVKMTTMIGAIVLLLHLMACVFYYAAHMKHEDVVMSYEMRGLVWETLAPGIHQSAWNQTWVGYAQLADQSKTTRYLTALYWSVYTLTTVGYGDIAPQNDYEKMVAVGAMMIGVTVFAYFMGNTASVIAAYNSQETAVSQAINKMKDFMQARHVPKKLANKITTFYANAARHQVIADKSLTDVLSVPLQTELMLFLYRKTLEQVPFFQGQDAQFITSLVSKLKMEYFAEDEVVVAEDDLGNVMYFVVTGLLEARHYATPKDQWFEKVQEVTAMEKELEKQRMQDEEQGFIKRLTNFRLVQPKIEVEDLTRDWQFYPNAKELGDDYDIVGTVAEGEHFGEYSCLLGLPRTSTVVALEFCELYGLSQPDLISVYKQWPDLYKEFKELVKQAEAAIGDNTQTSDNWSLEQPSEDLLQENSHPAQNSRGSIPKVKFGDSSPPTGGTDCDNPLDFDGSNKETHANHLKTVQIPGALPDECIPLDGNAMAETPHMGGNKSHGIMARWSITPETQASGSCTGSAVSRNSSNPEDEKSSLLKIESSTDRMGEEHPKEELAVKSKVQRKAKMIMAISKLGQQSDIENNPVFQLLNAGSDAKQERSRSESQPR